MCCINTRKRCETQYLSSRRIDKETRLQILVLSTQEKSLGLGILFCVPIN